MVQYSGAPELAQVEQAALAAAAHMPVGVNAALVPEVQLATAAGRHKQTATAPQEPHCSAGRGSNNDILAQADAGNPAADHASVSQPADITAATVSIYNVPTCSSITQDVHYASRAAPCITF